MPVNGIYRGESTIRVEPGNGSTKTNLEPIKRQWHQCHVGEWDGHHKKKVDWWHWRTEDRNCSKEESTARRTIPARRYPLIVCLFSIGNFTLVFEGWTSFSLVQEALPVRVGSHMRTRVETLKHSSSCFGKYPLDVSCQIIQPFLNANNIGRCVEKHLRI